MISAIFFRSSYSPLALFAGVTSVLASCSGSGGSSSGGSADPLAAAIRHVTDTPAEELDADEVQAAAVALAATGYFQSAEVAEDQKTILVVNGDGAVLHVDCASPTGVPGSSSLEPDDSRTEPQDSERGASSGSTALSFVPGLSALVFDPFSRGGSEVTAIKDHLAAEGFAITELSGSACTLGALDSAMKTGYGVVVFLTHGGLSKDGRTYFVLGQDYDPADATLTGILTQDQRKSVSSYLSVRDSTAEDAAAEFRCWLLPNSKCGKFTVDSRFFEAYSYPETLVWGGACSSFEKNDMAKAFLDRGAAAYLGWSKLTASVVDLNAAALFFQQMTTHWSTTVAGAVQACQYDRELHFLNVRLYSFDFTGSSVADLRFATRGGLPAYLLEPRSTIQGLGGRYRLTLFTYDDSGVVSGVLDKVFTALLVLGADDSITGDVEVYEIETNAFLYGTSITTGKLEGTNFVLEFFLQDGRRIQLSGRNTLVFSNGASYPDFRGLVGVSWFSEHVSAIGTRAEHGTWVGRQVGIACGALCFDFNVYLVGGTGDLNLDGAEDLFLVHDRSTFFEAPRLSVVSMVSCEILWTAVAGESYLGLVSASGIGDIDLDEVDDVAWSVFSTRENRYLIRILSGRTGGTIKEFPAVESFGFPHGGVTDLDRLGIGDIAVTNGVYSSESGGLIHGFGTDFKDAFDANGDGQTDFVFSGSLGALFFDGAAGTLFSLPIQLLPPFDAFSFSGELWIPDASGDGTADLIAIKGGRGTMDRELGLLSGQDGNAVWRRAFGEAEGLVDHCGDFDGDGRRDFYTLEVDSAANRLIRRIYSSGGDLLLEELLSLEEDLLDSLLLPVADADGDGRTDYLVPVEGSSRTCVSITFARSLGP